MMLDDKPTTDQSEESSHKQVRQLVKRIGELNQLLKTQQEILKQRGMGLPPSALQSLKTLHDRLEALSRETLMSNIELGHLRALADTTALINSSLDTSEVLNRVIDTVVHLTGAERGFIMLRNPEDNGKLEFVVTRGIDETQMNQNTIMVSQTIANSVAQNGEPELTSNASNDPRYQGNESIIGNALRSIIAVPMKTRGEVIGVLYCDNRFLAGVFNQHDLDLVTDFANQAAVAIENAQLFESARMRLSEVKETSDLISNILESIASGVIAIDQDGVINTCNPAAEDILEQPEDEEVVGRLLFDILPPSLKAPFETWLQQVSNTRQPLLVKVEPLLEGKGLRYWNVILSPLRDQRGQMQGITIVLDDLTDIHQRKEQVLEASRYLPPALVKNIRTFDITHVGGEEREITSMSADVRGFSTFSELLDPEVLMGVINHYLSLASDAINLYEGVVDKFLGDAVTGLFNTQLHPQPDHAVRAVRAAMSLMYDLHALHEILPPEQRLFYGLGIHTGKAVLGNVGSTERKEFAAIGEATDISKILEGNAKAGEIVISEATYQLVQDDFECVAFVPEKTKGHPELTIAYKVVKRKSTNALTLDDF